MDCRPDFPGNLCILLSSYMILTVLVERSQDNAIKMLSDKFLLYRIGELAVAYKIFAIRLQLVRAG